MIYVMKLSVDYLKKDYRGYISIDEGIDAILNRSQDKVSVPNELMMSLIIGKAQLPPTPAKKESGSTPEAHLARTYYSTACAAVKAEMSRGQ